MDAAVIGERFWPGAVAAIAGTGEAEVEEQLHRLVAGEVVRRARTSSVTGQREHAFLHALVRDVAYEQIPKAQRAQKHAAAAVWMEQLAGERVLDHAELIAHHYVAALEHAGDGDAELSAKTRRFLSLAGDRAMAGAARRLAGALGDRRRRRHPQRSLRGDRRGRARRGHAHGALRRDGRRRPQRVGVDVDRGARGPRLQLRLHGSLLNRVRAARESGPHPLRVLRRHIRVVRTDANFVPISAAPE
jgi:hypothetical protein